MSVCAGTNISFPSVALVVRKTCWHRHVLITPVRVSVAKVVPRLFYGVNFSSFIHGTTALNGPGPSHCGGFTITLRQTIVFRTPLFEWSVWRRDIYLAKHNTHNRQTSMSPGGFGRAIPASERPQTHALDRAATWTGPSFSLLDTIRHMQLR